MIKAVLFDMDGVLVDTEWFYNRRRVAFMEEKGFHFDEIPDLSGSNEPAIWEALVPDDVELRERLRVEYKQVYSPDHPVPYAELLNKQDGLFTVLLRGVQNGQAVEYGQPLFVIE